MINRLKAFVRRLRYRSQYRKALRAAKSRYRTGFDYHRRQLVPTLLLGTTAAVGVVQPAWADQNFTSFAFTGTGSPTSRTTPARIADVVNVKEWGATGDGSTDDGAAILAAINSISANGTVFFPPGTYVVNGTHLDLSVYDLKLTLRGSGAGKSIIISTSGTMTGYVIDHDITHVSNYVTIELLGITNTNIAAGGCLRLRNTGDGFEMRGCNISGFIGINIAGTASSELFAANTIHNCVLSCTAGSTAPTGSIGIVAGPHVLIESCSVISFWRGIVRWGLGGAIINTRTEVCNVGIMLGTDATDGNFAVTGGAVLGCTFEANLIGLYVRSAVNYLIGGCSFSFGANGPPSGSGSSTDGLYIGIAANTTIISCHASGAFTHFGIYVTDTIGAQTKLVFENCNAGSAGFGVGATVKLTNLMQHDCINFISFASTVALLPGNASNATEPPTQGERRLVTDANSSTFNAACAGGGSTTIFATYNGSAWVIG